jgi:hypothetical protein
MGVVPPFFSTYKCLQVMSYIQDVTIFRLSMKLNISVCVHVRYFYLVCGDDKLILFRHCKELKDYHCPEIQITHKCIYIYVYGTNYRMKNYKIDLRT